MTDTPTPEAIVKEALARAAEVYVKYPSNKSIEYEDGWGDARYAIQDELITLASDPEAVAEIIQKAGGQTEPNLYTVGYDVGFEDGFKEAQGRIKQLEARINELEAENSYSRQVAQYATDDAKEAKAYVEELEADKKHLRSMIADQINSTGDDPEIMAASRVEWAARALVAEADVAMAVEALNEIAEEERIDRLTGGLCLTDGAIIARNTLAKLKGEK